MRSSLGPHALARAWTALWAGALLLVAGAGSAWADPMLNFTATDLGGGFTAYDIEIDPGDGMVLPLLVDIAFTGNLNQIQAPGPTDVDTAVDAAIFDGLGGYDADLDSYFVTQEFAFIANVAGGEPGSTLYTFLGLTGGGNPVGVTPLAHLVAPSGEAILFDALVSRGGEDFDLAGVITAPAPVIPPIPEPSAAALFAIGFFTVAAAVRTRGAGAAAR